MYTFTIDRAAMPRDVIIMTTTPGIVPWGPQVDEILEVGEAAKRQVSESQRTPLVSLLLRGDPGCGKTALAAHIAKQCNFPFVKVSLYWG